MNTSSQKRRILHGDQALLGASGHEPNQKEMRIMGNTKENETVAGSGNSIAAVEGGYGPGEEGTGDGPHAPLTPERGLDSPGRQESQSTIRSRDPNTDEGISQRDLNEALGRDED